MLQAYINQPIPDFEFEAYHLNKRRKITLSEYRGKWLVLLFYPGDFTFICPTELEETEAIYRKYLSSLQVEVLGISTDSVYTHKNWHDTSPSIRNISFPLVADQTGKLSRAFGVYLENEGVALRGTFIIDPDGILKTSEVNNNDIGRSAEELLRKIQAAIFVYHHKGEVCPASWKPGDQTLKTNFDLS